MTDVAAQVEDAGETPALRVALAGVLQAIMDALDEPVREAGRHVCRGVAAP